MGPILVFGHRNPDNDSICSAVAYAHLKNMTDVDNVYVPARLGPVPAETSWVFERFGLEIPEEIAHVHTRVRDVMTEGAVTISPSEPMLAAGRLMRERDVRAIPVVAPGGAVVGLVSQRMLAERYVEDTGVTGFAEMPVTVERLVRVLEGELLAGDGGVQVAGSVLIGAAEPETLVARITPGDVVILGDRVRSQPMALEAGAACLIVTTGARPADAVIELARAKRATVISTSHDTYKAARLVSLAQAVGDLMDTDLLMVEPDTLLSEASEDLLASVHREAVVVDDERRVVGMLTRTDIARGMRRRVVLVDHNEAAQSASGIEDAAVVEIVDHHRIGDVQTAGPILFLNLPVGSTATIVAERYRTLGIEMPVSIAGVLLAAILTDTVLLKSPTTSDVDRACVERLSAAAALEPLEFGMELFRARAAAHPFSADEVVRADVKEYRLGEATVAIAQYEAVDLTELMEKAHAVRAAMEALRESRSYDLVLLMATDVVREGSEIFAVGRVRMAERALGVTLGDRSAWMQGVLSRKKQVAALLAGAATL